MPSVTHEKDVDSATGILSGPNDSADLPDWFREQQRSAWSKFESIPRPTRKDQPWRFSNVDLLDLSSFQTPGPLSEDDRKNILKYSSGLNQSAARMIFANDQRSEERRVGKEYRCGC